VLRVAYECTLIGRKNVSKIKSSKTQSLQDIHASHTQLETCVVGHQPVSVWKTFLFWIQKTSWFCEKSWSEKVLKMYSLEC